jgi:hypothetical protein
MAAFTLEIHRTETLALAGDPDADVFSSTTRLDRIINLAKDEVVALVHQADEGYFTKEATFNTVAGTREYALAADSKYIRKVWRLEGVRRYPLRSIDHQAAEALQQSPIIATRGAEFFYIDKDVMGLVPEPDSVIAIFYNYVARPADLVAGQSLTAAYPGWPEEWEHLIDIKAAIRCKLEMNEPVNVLQLREAQLIDRLIMEVRRRVRAQPRHMNIAESMDVI